MSGVGERAGRWVYRGVWGVLVDLLLVPDDPPSVPPGGGDVVRSVRPASGFLKYLKTCFWFAALAFDAVVIGVWVLILVANPIAGAITAPLFWAVAILPDIAAYVALHVRFDTTYYIVTERSVRIRRGVWLIAEHTITFENVQNVSVRQGPLQRWCGIADVAIDTAGGGGAETTGGSHQGLIQGVDNAAELRDLIMQRARAGGGAGLGDEGESEDPQRGRDRGLSPAHAAMLREIRDAIRLPRRRASES